ncbi:MAG: VTT domain-containing protein [Chloroflexi bacterium]|nr:VTT domain-containing protein [Chloroflexota bacterium]
MTDEPQPMRSQEEIRELRERVQGQLWRLLAEPNVAPDDHRVVRFQTTIDALDWALGTHAIVRPESETDPDDDALEIFAADDLTDEFLAAWLTPRATGRIADEKPLGRLARLEALDWRIKAQLTIAFAAAVIIPFYIFRQSLYDLGEWGYLGAFLVNGLSNATIVLPAPGTIIIALMAEEFDPLLIGIAAGVGGALGGMTSYVAGAINTTSQPGRWSRYMRSVMQRAGIPVLFFFSAIPLLPGDVASIVAGNVRYPIKMYLFVTSLGNIIKMSLIAYVGIEGLNWLQEQAVDLVRNNPFTS